MLVMTNICNLCLKIKEYYYYYYYYYRHSLSLSRLFISFAIFTERERERERDFDIYLIFLLFTVHHITISYLINVIYRFNKLKLLYEPVVIQ